MKKRGEIPVIEEMLRILDRAVEGDREALEELKEITAWIKELLPVLEIIEGLDGPEEIRQALQRVSDDYERLLLDVFRAVG